jgi:soluble lytic murein transglycosylase-like protein
MAQDWKAGGEEYLPALAAAEIEYAIPTDLLARIAYQESSWRADVVSGATRSAAGAVGLMQLMPQYFPAAGEDWQADILSAAQLLALNYRRFGNWQTALAAYNDGAGNVEAWLQGKRPLPPETQDYVAKVCADVPLEQPVINA